MTNPPTNKAQPEPKKSFTEDFYLPGWQAQSEDLDGLEIAKLLGVIAHAYKKSGGLLHDVAGAVHAYYQPLIANQVAEALEVERKRIYSKLWRRGIKLPLKRMKSLNTRPKIEKYEIENLDTRVRVSQAAASPPQKERKTRE